MKPEAFKIYIDNNAFNIGDQLSVLLYECGAIISGGAILTSIYGGRLNDIDIYVNLSNSQKLYTGLMTMSDVFVFGKVSTHPVAPPYDSSFMVKNHILGRQQLILNPPGFEKSVVVENSVLIDFMIVDDGIPVTYLPKNFDITFCMNWYDGKDLVFTNPDDVKTKTGILSKDYLDAFLQGNNFTIKRMKKYTMKGYTISYPSKIPKDVKFTINSKKVITPDIWVTNILLKYILSQCDQNQPFSVLIIFLYKLKKLQVERGDDMPWCVERKNVSI
jgi:hypothetical protein